MKVLLKEGVEAGAVGFSTSRTLVHRSADGNLVPTYKAATRELKSLGESLSGQKGHVFQLISDWEDPQDEFSILKEVSEKTGAKEPSRYCIRQRARPLGRTVVHG